MLLLISLTAPSLEGASLSRCYAAVHLSGLETRDKFGGCRHQGGFPQTQGLARAGSHVALPQTGQPEGRDESPAHLCSVTRTEHRSAFHS